MRRTGLVALALFPLACQSTPSQPRERTPLAGLEVKPDLAVSKPPFDEVHASWKQRIAQPYVYVEARGSYTKVGERLGEVVRLTQEQGLEVNGPPFALYYDDPGHVAVGDLRMRACLPVAGPIGHKSPLDYDVLESTTVVYAFASGPYPDVPRIYPGLFAYLGELGWSANGPIRESYLVNPADVTDFSELVTEVQIPAASAR